MGIKIKLLLVIAFTVLLTTAGILGVASLQLKTALSSEFEVNSQAQLGRMEAFVNMFFTDTIASAELIATSPAVLNGVNHMTSYAEKDEEHTPVGENLEGAERAVFDEVSRFARLFPAYLLVYVGHSNGGFVQSPNDPLAPHYNPGQRPWFTDTVSAGKPIVTEAYLSTTGQVVCTVTALVDTAGNGKAVAGIDIEIGRLSKEIANVTIGQTGYLMMLDHLGQIVADPRSGSGSGQRQWLGKAIAPVPTDDSVEVLPEEIASVLKLLVDKKQGFAEVRLEGVEWLAGVDTTEQGWTLIMLQRKDEIFAEAFSITLKILEVGALIAAVMVVCAYFVARSIAQPVSILSEAAQKVAAGDLNAIPKQHKGFTGELGILHSSLQRMVGKLVELIDTAEGKIKEAESALEVSKNALEQAEEAKLRADRARGEAILETASKLVSVVEKLASTAHGLEKGAHDSTRTVDNQRDRLANTATAINQMNATVVDVARNIASTANLASEARQGAITGKNLVLGVVDSVRHLENSSKALNTSLESLGGQVADIGQIMGVINDIPDQTNLLALNAAIEAARAGEAGRGFAVVADEVRKLAESTVNATKQVGSAIVNIQKGTEENRKAMAAASEAVAQSTSVAGKAGEAIGVVEELVVHTADNLRAIAAASEEQSASSDEINSSINDVTVLADNVGTGIHHTASIARDLVAISDSLSQIIQSLQNSTNK